MCRKISRDDLLTELRRLKNELGKVPSQNDMESKGVYSKGPYDREFGSWSKALKTIGVESGRARPFKLTEKELLDALLDLAEELGKTPTKQEMNECGEFPDATYWRRFGSWNEALEEAGLELNYGANGESVIVKNYGPNWPEQREKALERDEYVCQSCDRTQDDSMQECGRGLHVHHIIPRRDFRKDGELDYETANELQNLVSYCPWCHRKHETSGGAGTAD